MATDILTILIYTSTIIIVILLALMTYMMYKAIITLQETVGQLANIIQSTSSTNLSTIETLKALLSMPNEIYDGDSDEDDYNDDEDIIKDEEKDKHNKER